MGIDRSELDALTRAMDSTLERMAGGAMRQPLEEILDVIEMDIEARIDRGISMARGARFKSLSPRYKKWKDKHYPGLPILKRTGAMLAGANVNREIGDFDASLLYVAEYAAHHQFGGGRVPARPFAGISADADREALDVLEVHLDEILLEGMNAL